MAKLVQDLGKLKKRLREETEGQADAPAPASKAKAADKGSAVADVSASKKARGTTGNDVNKSKEVKKAVDTKKVLAKAGAKSKAKGKGRGRGRQQDEDPAEMHVIYIGHAPKGFEEEAMEKFFSQFGKVRRVKVFRSAKTGNTKGYAFVQFADAEVAQVAAESTDGYLLGDRQLVAHVVDKSKCHAGMFLPYKQNEEGQVDTAAPSNGGQDEEISKTKRRRMNRSAQKLRAIAAEYGL
jgi:RNA recognition motif-containing protein